MKKKATFQKVSVSLPAEVHEWIKAEAKSRADRYGEHWPASRIVQEALREYRTRAANAAPMGQAMPDLPRSNEQGNDRPQSHSGPTIMNPRKTSAGGSDTPKPVACRKAGRAGK